MWHISQITQVVRTDTLAAVSDRETHEIAVVGAGTTGASIAYHLTQRGRRPLLLDRAGAAGGPSGASAAMLRQHYLEPAIIELARFGCGFLAEMDELTGFASGFVGCGYVVVAGAEQEARVRDAYAAMRAADVRVELLDLAGLRSLEPRLRTDDLAIGCYEPAVGYCEPLFVAAGLAAAAERDGATLRLDCEVCSIARDGVGYRLELDRRRDVHRGRRRLVERAARCARGSRSAHAAARPDRSLPPAGVVRGSGPDHLGSPA
jgi:glycine/D-amino acid oxidase-like deaminating enzyme